MIIDLFRYVSESGVELTKQQRDDVMAKLCKDYGHTERYVPGFAKLQNQVRMAALGTGIATTAMAAELGLSVRQVRRYTRGR